MPQAHPIRQKPLDDAAAGSARRQAEAGKKPAEVLAFLEMDLAAVDLGHVAHDGEAQSGAGLARRVEPGAAREQLAATFLGNAWAVVLDEDVDVIAFRLDRHEHAPAAIFGCVLD